jgi:hypothetical protein
LRSEAVKYRNEFLAHLGEQRKANLPSLDLMLRSVMYYHAYVMKHENDGRTYGGLPAAPRAIMPTARRKESVTTAKTVAGRERHSADTGALVKVGSS